MAALLDMIAELDQLDETYLCQMCGVVKDARRFPPEWRPDVTGHESAGNVCPQCMEPVHERAFAAQQVQRGANENNSPELTLTPTPGPLVPGKFNRAEDARDFILAGDAYFTLVSQRSGTRYTYHSERVPCSRCGARDCHCWNYPMYWISVLVGPDNWANYKFIGILKDNTFQRTDKSKLSDNTQSVIAFKWMWKFLTNPLGRQQFVASEIWHEGKCGRCGHKLTVPESIARGIGPECAERMGIA